MRISQEEMEKRLESFLPSDAGLAVKLLDALRYSFLAGGKRLRPRLMLESYEAFGGSGEAVYPFMAALEMIHSYSLVHDDLPCMDNDTLRRGKPTTWSVYGDDFGVLAGDSLLNLAFETALKAFRCDDTPPERIVAALEILAGKAGIFGMCGGQSLDVEKTGQPLNSEEMDFIYRLKTGALLEAALMIGAVLAGADEEQLKTVEGLGRDVGCAFQIRDDILDITADEASLGKNIGSDEKNGKTTYVSLYGLDAAQQKVERLSASAAAALSVYPKDSSALRELIENMSKRNK